VTLVYGVSLDSCGRDVWRGVLVGAGSLSDFFYQRASRLVAAGCAVPLLGFGRAKMRAGGNARPRSVSGGSSQFSSKNGTPFRGQPAASKPILWGVVPLFGPVFRGGKNVKSVASGRSNSEPAGGEFGRVCPLRNSLASWTQKTSAGVQWLCCVSAWCQPGCRLRLPALVARLPRISAWGGRSGARRRAAPRRCSGAGLRSLGVVALATFLAVVCLCVGVRGSGRGHHPRLARQRSSGR